MSKRTQRKRSAGRGELSSFLCMAVLAVFFLAGTIAGQATARKNPDAVDTELSRYLTDYFRLAPEERDSGRVFLSALLVYFRYPLTAFALGFSMVGLLFLPLISAAFGYFLSYSVCCFAGALGGAGIPAALAVFGLRGIITLPCFFLIAAVSLRRAWILLYGRVSGGGRRLIPPRNRTSRWLETGIVAAVLLAGALAEVIVSPALLQLVLEKILLM